MFQASGLMGRGPARLDTTPRGRIPRRDFRLTPEAAGVLIHVASALRRKYDSARMYRRVLLACLCTIAAPTWGQTPGTQPPTFHADTHLVQVNVVVTDSRQNPVRDLKASDFRVFED